MADKNDDQANEANDRVLIVSADAHAAARPEDYRPYLEGRYHPYLENLSEDFHVWSERLWPRRDFTDAVIDIMDVDDAIRSGGRNGGFDLARRLTELDREGVAAEIIHPSTNNGMTPFFAPNCRFYPADVRAAGARAYHRWLADMIESSNGRLFGIANPGPCLDMDETLQEMSWVASHGFVSIAVPGSTFDSELPPLGDKYFEPFWTACTELGLVLSVHAGYGGHQGEILKHVERLEAIDREAAAEKAPASGGDPMQLVVDPKTAFIDFGSRRAIVGDNRSPFDLNVKARRVIWQLMLSGVFDRHPDLRLALTETRLDWIPTTLRQLDELLATEHAHMKLKPSEYWRRNCFGGASAIHKAEVELRYEIGIDQMMFGTDFPHLEATWPNTRDWIRDAFADVPENEAHKILSENAINCYGLDSQHLNSVASRIGRTRSDLFGGGTVSPELIDTFHLRAGYLRPAEEVNLGELREAVTEDVEVVHGLAAV